jgi:hypothetical protein
VTEHICKLARKGMTPSQIGVLLRDSHGIPQVRPALAAGWLEASDVDAPLMPWSSRRLCPTPPEALLSAALPLTGTQRPMCLPCIALL